MSYKGAKSEPKNMPGGGPQGTLLGMFLFLILINDAGYSVQNRELGSKITRAINKRKEIENKHWKYVDDLTVAEALDLKTVFVEDEENILEKTLTYHNRTNKVLPIESSKVQQQLNDLNEYAQRNEIKINKEKTKVMLFNTAKTKDFTSNLKIGNTQIEVVEDLKLLGVKITNDLKWNAHISNLSKKGYTRMWILRRLKKMEQVKVN